MVVHRRIRFVAVSVLLVGVVHVRATSQDLAIIGGRLLDGFGGQPVDRSVVLVRGDQIVAVGTEGQVTIPAGAKVMDASGMTVMPGLIDMHVHLSNVGHTDLKYPGLLYRRGRTRDVMAANAKALVLAGVTTARDVGAPLDEILSTRERVNRSEIPGPRLFVSGPYLVKFAAPEDAFDHLAINGTEDARTKVRNLIARGVDLVKVRDIEKMTPGERTAIVDEAHKAGKHLATHGIYPEEIRAALEAGFDKRDTFEHTGLLGNNPEYAPALIQAVVDRGIHIVPTIVVIETFSQMESFPGWKDDRGWKASLPPDIWQEVRASLDAYQKLWFFSLAKYGWNARRHKLQQLVSLGAEFAMGSDSGARANPHTDAAWREMELMREIGISPMEVIMESTRIPAQILGIANQVGTIEVGKKADLLVIDGDPLRSFVFLRHPAHVIKNGTVYR